MTYLNNFYSGLIFVIRIFIWIAIEPLIKIEGNKIHNKNNKDIN